MTERAGNTNPMFWSFLKAQTEKNIGPSGQNPDNSSFDGTAPKKFRCFPELIQTLGGLLLFRREHAWWMMHQVWNTWRMPSVGTLGSYESLSPNWPSGCHFSSGEIQQDLLCWKWNLNHTESTGSYIRWSHQISVYDLHLLSVYWILF